MPIAPITFLQTSEFTGRFELHTGMYDQQKLTDYIQRYEQQYLIELFGAKMYDEFMNDYFPPNLMFWSPNFQFMFDPFHLDSNVGGNHLISIGIRDMLKGFIYWEYMKDTINQMTPIGNVIPQNQNSRVNSTIYSSMWSRYNESIKTFRAIQMYIVLNRPIADGQVTTNGIQFTSGSLYYSMLYQTINFNSIQYDSATALTIQNAGTGYTSQQNVLCNPSGVGVIVDVVANQSGNVTSVTIVNGGENLSVGDTLTLLQGNGNCVLQVAAIDNIIDVNPNGSGMVVDVTAYGIGGVKTTTLLTGGTGYQDGTAIATIGGTGQQLEIDVTTDGNGVVTDITMSGTCGYGYTIGDVITIDDGNGDATFEVDTLWNGEIQSISYDRITQSGHGYSTGDTLVIDGGDQHAIITCGYVGKGSATNWNGRDKQMAYWI